MSLAAYRHLLRSARIAFQGKIRYLKSSNMMILIEFLSKMQATSMSFQPLRTRSDRLSTRAAV